MKAELIILGGLGCRHTAAYGHECRLADEAGHLGLELAFVTRTTMQEREVTDCLRHAMGRAHLVVVSGPGGISAGTGSGAGDIVKKTLSRILDRRLILNEEMLERSRAECSGRGSKGSGGDKSALLPSGSMPITDADGCPAGFYLQERGRFVVFLSDMGRSPVGVIPQGVAEKLKPRVRARSHESTIMLRTYGVSTPSVLDAVAKAAIENAEAVLFDGPDGVDIYITAKADTKDNAEEEARDAAGRVSAALGGHVYAAGPEGIESAVAALLTERGLTVSTAESCTGGLIAKRLTDVPGSTAYMERGMVTYSNRSKAELLGVPNETIETHGAVSEPTAKAMAEGVRWYSNTDIGLAVTGIAGPGGGTDEKPVGLVYIALAYDGGVDVKKCNFAGGRSEVRYATSQKALDMVRRHLIG